MNRFKLNHFDENTKNSTHNGHEYVEIGGIKWATCNVGAEKPTDRGLYFAWGETNGFTAEQVMKGEKDFNWDFYKYGNRSPFLKYNAADDKIVLDLEDDAAHVNMGNGWRMPTEGDFQALLSATTDTWIANYQDSGINGRLFTDKKDSSKTLFFPTTGYCNNSSVYSIESNGYYWLSLLDTRYPECAFNLNIDDWGVYYDKSHYRRLYFAVRGVVAE